MRDRRQASSNSDTDNDLRAHRASARGPEQLERIFRPEELDLDGLAEALRSLLGHGGAAPPLLSVAPRGTHRVEAKVARHLAMADVQGTDLATILAKVKQRAEESR